MSTNIIIIVSALYLACGVGFGSMLSNAKIRGRDFGKATPWITGLLWPLVVISHFRGRVRIDE